MKPILKTFQDNPAVAEAFAEEFAIGVNVGLESQRVLNVVLSGGSTPSLFFSILAERYSDQIEWSRLHFFWADERCVSPADIESNFGEANRLLFSNIEIPTENIHRIRGENDPETERARYEAEIVEHVEPNDSGMPRFDMVLLGMGADGHTASLFPNQQKILESNRICEIATHPVTAQLRITLTTSVLNAGRQVVFLVTGENKAEVLVEIIQQTGNYLSYPASSIALRSRVTLFIDEAAGSRM